MTRRILRAVRVRFTSALACAAALFVSLVTTGAHASELSWDGPPECAEHDSLSFQVERAVGAPLERIGNLTFYVRVEIDRGVASARLRVKSADSHSEAKERLIGAADCSKLVDTLAVAIALALGDAREVAPPVESSAAAQLAVAPPDTASRTHSPDTTIASSSSDRDQSGPSPSALAFLVGDVGALPSPALGIVLGAALSESTLQLRAIGTLLFDQRARTDGSPAGGEVGLAYGTLMACVNPLVGGVSVVPALCAGFDLGRMNGVGRGVVTTHERAVLWLSPRLDANLSWRVPQTRLRLNALLGFAAPLNRDAFILDAIGTVHRPAQFVARTGIGVELLF